MDRKNIIITIIVVAVVVIAVGAALLSGNLALPKGTSAPGGSGGAGGAGANAGGAASSTAPVTRTAVPANVAVPGAGATSTAANIAVPTIVSPANPTNSASFRSFNIQIANGAFSPDQIIVYVGDTVSVSFTAVDQAYDWTLPDYGMQVSIPKGTTRQVQLSPHAVGKFLFYCTSCGGPEKGPTGYLVVAPKQ